MQTVDDLLRLVAPFCEARKISESRLSKLMFNDGKRVRLMRDRNGDIGSRQLRKAFAWMSGNWPPGAVWPVDVERPLAEEEAA